MAVFTASSPASIATAPSGMPGTGPYFAGALTDLPGGFPGDAIMYASPDHANPSDGIYAWILDTGGDPTDSADWYDITTHYAANTAAWNTYGVSSVLTQGRVVDDTFGSATASSDNDAGETPSVVRLGSTYYMTAHSSGLGQGTGAGEQSTWVASSTNLIDWSYIGLAGTDYDPAAEIGNGHDGYIRTIANPGISGGAAAYAFVGYGLHGGGNTSSGALFATDDPSAQSWTKVAILPTMFGGLGIGSGQKLTLAYADAGSWTTLPTGEVAFIAHSSDIGTSGALLTNGKAYMVTTLPDGITPTREAELVLEGSAGTFDEHEVQHGASIADPTRTHDLLYFYQGGDDTDSDGTIEVNTIGVVGIDVDPTATLPTPLSRTNHTLHEYDFLGAALPTGTSATVSGSGGVTPQESIGVRTTSEFGGDVAGIKIDDVTIDPTTDWFELVVHNWDRIGAGGPGGANTIVRFGLSDTGWPENPGDGLLLVGYGSIDGEVQFRRYVSGSNAESDQVAFAMGNAGEETTSIKDIGFRWNPNTKSMTLLMGTGGALLPVNVATLSTLPPSGDMTPYFTMSNWPGTWTAITLRKQTASGGVAPAIASVEAIDDRVDVTLDKACIGLTGFSVTEDASPVTVTATRISGTLYRLTRTSGTFTDGATVEVTYTAAGGDIRSTADLVAILDNDSASALASLASLGTHRSSRSFRARGGGIR